VRDVGVTDQRFRIDVDVDLPAVETATGSEPGSCP